MQVVEVDRGEQVAARADRHDPGVARLGQGVVQPGRKLEVAEVVGRELHLPPVGSVLQVVGERHDAGVVHQHIQRPAPLVGDL